MSAFRLPGIDFDRIRPYGQPASRASAFEEMASILIEQGVVEWPEGVRFERFGNPDGGREGRGVLPNGDVWAWQAKYLRDFGPSAAAQVTASVIRALEVEPSLKRYFVTLPIDRPAGDTTAGGAKKESAYTRWARKVAEWQEAAREKGTEVEFVFIGAHELVAALTEPRHAGRVRYWFSAGVLSAEWQADRVEEAVARAGRRYSPALHVEVEAVRGLDAVGRTEAWTLRWRNVLAGLRAARSLGREKDPWETAAGKVPDALARPFSRCIARLDEADAALARMITALGSAGPLPPVDGPLDDALHSLLDMGDLLRRPAEGKDRDFTAWAGPWGYGFPSYVAGALREGARLAASPAAAAAAGRFLLLTGRAGVGKTHLLCDVARGRTAEGRPTVLILGQDFGGSQPLLAQVARLSQLGETADDVLAVLDAASEAAGCTGLLMIDALNESERPERWRGEAQVLAAMAERYPHVAVVLSCRTEFLGKVIGDTGIPAVEHVGFGEATDSAIRRFTREYGLELPAFPVLNPEFGNPLFLKLACEALDTLGRTRFPLGTAGLATVCGAFFEAVNKRLAREDRCDYDERDNLVQQAVRRLAMLGGEPMDRAEVTRIIREILPGERGWSRSLMRGLIAEGVLAELDDDRIAFGYQRLGDIARAAVMADKPLDDVRAWLRGLGENAWRESGTLGALAVIIPERHGVELIDLGSSGGYPARWELSDGFLASLTLRAPGSVSPRTAQLVRQLLGKKSSAAAAWDQLVRIACIPGHPLNADWLHALLAAFPATDRDRSWCSWLAGAMKSGEETSVRRLVHWAWPRDIRDRPVVPDDVAGLAVLVLGWFLAAADREVRDHATKAIVSIAERAPEAFARSLASFAGTNDPYVAERLAAAACGTVLRTEDSGAIRRIADSLQDLFGDEWPLHLLTRDYARRVFDAARACGWDGPDARPPYGARWPVPTLPAEEIEAMAGPPGYAYGPVWGSLTGTSDFGYKLWYAIDATYATCAQDSEALRQEAERAVFDRVRSLGWVPKPSRRDAGGWALPEEDDPLTDKYLSIGFHEIIGRIADNHPLAPDWVRESAEPYEYAEQLVERDIDPTLLARPPHPAAPGTAWSSPAAMQFPHAGTAGHPADMEGMPDPLDLITVRDPDGAPWLVVATAPKWSQPLPPEMKAQQATQLRAWMDIWAYLVPQAEVAALRRWARGKDWDGRWMPEPPRGENLLLAAHPVPAWWPGNGQDAVFWSKSRGPQPAEFTLAAVEYPGARHLPGTPARTEAAGFLPGRRLFDVLGLRRGIDFSWSDDSGIAVQDPSVASGGPAVLAMRPDLATRLADAGLALFWTALAGCEAVPSGTFLSRSRDHHPGVSASASYILTGTQVEQVHAIATRYGPEPEPKRTVKWQPRKSQDMAASRSRTRQPHIPQGGTSRRRWSVP